MKGEASGVHGLIHFLSLFSPFSLIQLCYQILSSLSGFPVLITTRKLDSIARVLRVGDKVSEELKLHVGCVVSGFQIAFRGEEELERQQQQQQQKKQFEKEEGTEKVNLFKMAASSTPAQLFGIREEEQNQVKQQHSAVPSSSNAPAAAPPKKKRNQPGTPSKYLTS